MKSAYRAVAILLRWLPARWATALYYRVLRKLPWDLPGRVRIRYGKMDMHIHPSDPMHREIAFVGCYEAGLAGLFRERGRRGGCLIDVGANAGYYTLFWAGMSSGNRVAAFEPHPPNADLLERSIEWNGLAQRVSLHRMACGEREGEMRFGSRWDADHTGNYGFVSEEEGVESRAVRVVTLDGMAESFPEEIAFLKIDAEGADALVLRGARVLLQARRIRAILFERNYWRMECLGIDPEADVQLLESCGYRHRRLGPASEGLENYLAWPEE